MNLLQLMKFIPCNNPKEKQNETLFILLEKQCQSSDYCEEVLSSPLHFDLNSPVFGVNEVIFLINPFVGDDICKVDVNVAQNFLNGNNKRCNMKLKTSESNT